MARSTRSTTVTVTVYEEHDGIEQEYEVTCSVSPGSPARGPSYASGGEPEEPPAVEVTLVRDGLGALDAQAAEAFVAAHLAQIEEDALARVRDRYAAEDESAGEAERERAREDRAQRGMAEVRL